MRRVGRGAGSGIAAAAMLLLLTGASAHAQGELPEMVPVENPRAKRLQFATTLSRLKYRQETRTKEFYRPPGRRKGKVDEHTLRHEFQVSIWEVPSGSGVLRMETLPIMIGAQVGEDTAGGMVQGLPVSVRYMLRSGKPCNYYGSPQEDERPTALVFPDHAIEPGDTWTRMVAPSDTFEIPTQSTFTYEREVRIRGRLCSVIKMVSKARGDLPDERGLASLSARARFIFDQRLGRVVHTKTRLFQSIIGKAQQGIPPEKRKTEQAIELWAML